MKASALLAVLALIAGCASVPATSEPQPPIAQPEPTPSSLVVRLEDYAACFIERTAGVMHGVLVIGPCP